MGPAGHDAAALGVPGRTPAADSVATACADPRPGESRCHHGQSCAAASEGLLASRFVYCTVPLSPSPSRIVIRVLTICTSDYIMLLIANSTH
jgi:hypothetical protein